MGKITISSVTNQGKLRFMCYESSFTYQVSHQFLQDLAKNAKGRKACVIVDNLRVHHAEKIRRWPRMYINVIEVHYLPSYSPDLNSDEYLNCDLKTELAKRPERRQKGKWAKTVADTMKRLSHEYERVESYFKTQPIQYAALNNAWVNMKSGDAPEFGGFVGNQAGELVFAQLSENEKCIECQF